MLLFEVRPTRHKDRAHTYVPRIVEQCGEYSPPSIDENKIINEHTNVHDMNMKIVPSDYI
jgi:hypothetical protein